MNKIRIVIITKTKTAACNFLKTLMNDSNIICDNTTKPLIYENSMLHICWLKEYSDSFAGYRINFVYADPDVLSSQWFGTVVEPCFIRGVGNINES